MAKKMDAAGLFGVQLDGLASVYGSAGVDNIPTLLMGAHTDTRRRSSALDGAVGIAFALEASRVLHLGGAADWTAWSIVDWQLADSIHPAGTGLTGPRAFVSEDGVFTPSDQLWRARGAAGVAGTPIMHASGRHGGWNAYLEARVERGTHLRSVNATLGVVRSIAGVRRVRIVCGETAASKVSDGSPAYVWRRAGTLEAMRLATALDDRLHALCASWQEGGCDGAWRFVEFGGFGKPPEEFEPSGGVVLNADASGASLTLELRAADASLLERMARLVDASVSAGKASAAAPAGAHCTLHPEDSDASLPASTLDAGLLECIRIAAATTVGDDSVAVLESPEVLSASLISQVMPAAMIMLPSAADGEGLEKEEDGEEKRRALEAAIVDGARAYVRAAVDIALGACESESGPTCILGDSRRNVQLASSDWSRKLEQVDTAPRATASHSVAGATSDGGDEEVEDDYPDL